ncbi:MAG: HAD hydrolase family protein [Coprobacillus cateniformis]|uniref:HAD family hydrolase n=1 Tax=Longibaculum muris TaxID=1796628 RepID=UPI003AB61559|nr:HAD hydrolase family protein [Coprobacillus cateniformis]
MASLEDLLQVDYFGISLDVKTAENASKIHQEIVKKYNDDIDAYQNIQYIDIVKKGYSKGNGILKVKEYFHFDYMYALGDSYNDLSMFEQSDYCFTFEESLIKLKEQCQGVVLSVAQAIEKIREGV